MKCIHKEKQEMGFIGSLIQLSASSSGKSYDLEFPQLAEHNPSAV